MTRSNKILAIATTAPLLLALFGCSPHPASGTWTAAATTDSGFNRIDVNFDGKADLYEVGEDNAGRHCFWGRESKQAITLTCKPAFDTDIEERYRLIINEDGTATLMQDNTMAARFSRPPQQAPN